MMKSYGNFNNSKIIKAVNNFLVKFQLERKQDSIFFPPRSGARGAG